jgi:preprotein translocase subunit SecB
MADEPLPPQAGGTPQQAFSIQKVYLRDVSFEGPNSPAIFAGSSWEPDINLSIGSNHRKVGDEFYEVVLNVTVTTKIGDKTAYLAEVQQAGVFLLRGFAEADLGPMLGSFCPNILFPFAREEVANLVTKGGFPQLLLEPINFDAVYAQSMQKQPAGATESA